MPAYSDKILSYNVWGYWKLNDATASSLADSGTNARPLTLNGTAPTLSVAGALGDPTYTSGNTAISTVGTTEYYNNTTPTSIRTIIVWFKTSTTPGTNNHMPLFMTWYHGNGNAYFGLAINAVGNLVGRQRGSTTYDIVSPSTVSDGAWHMAVLSYDPVKFELSMFLDAVHLGTIYANDTNTIASRVRMTYGTFGTLPGGGGNNYNYYTGSIDEVSALNTTLNATQIAELYDIGAPRFDRQETYGAFSATVVPNPLNNDNFIDATTVAIPYGTTSFRSPGVDSAGATTEVGEPSAVSGSSNRSAWWKYTPAYTGTAVFDTIGSYQTADPTNGFADTQIAIYTGTALNNLVFVGGDQDSGGTYGGKSYTSRASVAVTAGTTYYLQVGTYSGGAVLTYVVNINGPSTVLDPPNTPGDFTFQGGYSASIAVVVPPGSYSPAPIVDVGNVSIDSTPTVTATSPVSITQEDVKTLIRPGAPRIQATQEDVKVLVRPSNISTLVTQEVVKTLIRTVPIPTASQLSGYSTGGAVVTGALAVAATQRDSANHVKIASKPDPVPEKLSEEHAKVLIVPDPYPQKISQEHVKIGTEQGVDNPQKISQEHAKTAYTGVSARSMGQEHIKIATSDTEPATGRMSNQHIKIAELNQVDLTVSQEHLKIASSPDVDPYLTHEHLKVASSVESYPVTVFAESLMVAFRGVSAYEISQAHAKVIYTADPVEVVSQAHAKTIVTATPDTRNTAAHTKVAAVILSADEVSAAHTKVAVTGLRTTNNRRRGWGVLV